MENCNPGWTQPRSYGCDAGGWTQMHPGLADGGRERNVFQRRHQVLHVRPVASDDIAQPDAVVADEAIGEFLVPHPEHEILLGQRDADTAFDGVFQPGIRSGARLQEGRVALFRPPPQTVEILPRPALTPPQIVHHGEQTGSVEETDAVGDAGRIQPPMQDAVRVLQPGAVVEPPAVRETVVPAHQQAWPPQMIGPGHDRP